MTPKFVAFSHWWETADKEIKVREIVLHTDHIALVEPKDNGAVTLTEPGQRAVYTIRGAQPLARITTVNNTSYNTVMTYSQFTNMLQPTR